MTVPEEMAAEAANKKAEREALRGVIQQWNANRLDLFELSEPNEDLEFHGVMRFYFQDSGQKVATKCIRVASDATSQAVIETLIEKFRPDMRMLSVPEYALYEIHENGEERKLGLEEKPLLVQLNWHIDDREGRFLLKRIDDKTNAQGVGFPCSEGSSFRRKLSKREKKQMKKQEKLSRLKSLEQDENTAPTDQNGVAEKLYTELPETSFTRSISNPEAVMRRRRQQKLERKLQQFRSKDGGPDTGGTLKIYGEALCKDVPYKTLLLSVRDSAAQVVREMLAKYGLDKVDPQQYCLVQVNTEGANGNAHQEYILDDDECPLAILMNHPSTRGSIMFHVRRRPADYVPRKRKKKPAGKWSELDHRYEDERLPFLLELNPDGTDIPNGAGIRHRLQPNVTEVGSERPIGPQAVQAQTLTLSGPTVMPRHCVIAFTENIVTLTPCSRDAHTYVNNQRIHQTTILQNGAIVKFGRMHTFRFIDPAPEERIRQRHDSNRQLDYAYDRRSPDTTSQDMSSDKYRSGSGTPNGGGQVQSQGQNSNPPSPSKSCAAPSGPRSPTHSGPTTEGPTHNYETTFDLDGNVETASLTSSRDGNRLSQYDRQPRGTDPILPAVLEFLEETEEAFLHAVITDVEPSAPQFKLAPTYTLYLAARYRASTHYRPELQPTERAHRLTVMLANVATMIQRVIQERYMDASSLALWLANGSELLHMLKNDRHVGAFSTRAQDILADAVHTAFASLVRCVSLELAPAMSQFMADADEPAKEAGVLQIFSNTMALLRRCRVNAALTIQLFSHLFHAINATAFNALVSNGNLCVRWFGRRLKARLNALETWAERQGLELASQCHLATIMQATHLLQAPKYNAEELATLSSTCFKLNSLQVRALLQKYQPAADEPRLPAELIENVVRVAESVADTLARADGREIRLEEEPTLALALLLPEDGYSCEVIRGVPPGLAEFLAPLQRDGLCRMAPQPTSSGYWTIYMIDHHNNLRSPSAMSNRSGGYSGYSGQAQGQPEIQVIKLHKSTNGMGLSIVAAKGAGQDRLGIYIKSVVAGGAADADGRLTAGDQLLKVDGQSLVGITQEKAAEYLVRTGPIVTLEVAKQGAIYHGLATLLSQPSPVMTRAHKGRPKSEHLEPGRLQDGELAVQPSSSHSMGNLLSVPSRQTAPSYQERSVDWEVDRNMTLPGATVPSMPAIQPIFNRLNQQTSARFTSQPDRCDGRSSCHFPDQMQIPMPQRVPNRAYLPRHNSNSLPRCESLDSYGRQAGCLSRYADDFAQSAKCSSLHNRKFVRQVPEFSKHAYLTIPRQIGSRAEPLAACAPCQLDVYSQINDSAGPFYPDNDKTEAACSYDAELHRKCPRNLMNAEEKGETAISFESEPSIPFIDQIDEIVVPDKSAVTQRDVHCQTKTSYFSKASDTSGLVPDTREEAHFSQLETVVTASNADLSTPTEATKNPTINIEDVEDEGTLENKDLDADESTEADEETEDRISTEKMHMVMPELNLDLSGLKDDANSEDSDAVVEKCWKSPEEVRLGCGRVAALAKHFSQLGDAGLIRLKSTTLSHSRQFVSEPDITSPRSPERITYGKYCPKEFKSESDLSRIDKSVQVTPIEERWSMILLNIQDRHGTSRSDEDVKLDKSTRDVEAGEMLQSQNESGTEKVEEDTNATINIDESQGQKNKLSLAEQEEIIKQLKEFCDLDNKNAPLFIPEISTDTSEGNDKAVESYSRSNLSYNSCDFRPSSSLTTVANFEANDRTEKLTKFWSLGDLTTDESKLKMISSISCSDDFSKFHLILPACARVVSAPEISNDGSSVFYIRMTSPSNSENTLSASILNDDVYIANADLDTTKPSKSYSWEVICSADHKFRASGTRKLMINRRSSHPCADRSYKCRKHSLKSSRDELELLSSTSMPRRCQVAKHGTQPNDARCCSDNQTSQNVVEEREVDSTSLTGAKRCTHHQVSKKVDRARSVTSIPKLGPIEKKPLIMLKRSKSDYDVSERKATPRYEEREGWTFREIPSLEKYDLDSRPRRMSERDLPSRLGHDPTPQQIHISKSVPALHNMGAEGKQQHEIFNPGYSRASSSNSVTPPVQPPPMPAINGTTSLRSRSSHNLHDPARMGTLPPTGLVSRQQSSPNLNPPQSHGNHPSNSQNNEAERFYQNLSIYRNQDGTSTKQQPSPPQHMDERGALHAQKSLRGSQNSLNRPSTYDTNQRGDRPISAYIPQQSQQQNFVSNQMQHQGPPPPRSQSSRDIIRQEAKLQEMQEEVRRRELRGGGGPPGAPTMMNQYRPSAHNARPIAAPIQPVPNSTLRQQKPLGSTPNLGPTSPTGNFPTRQAVPSSNYSDAQYAQYAQYAGYGQYGQYSKHPGSTGQPYGIATKGRNEPIRQHMPPSVEPSKDYGPQEPSGRTHMEQNRQFAGPQNAAQYSNEITDVRNRQYSSDAVTSRTQNGGEASVLINNDGHPHSALSEDGYRESPPPPPPNTSTHPLYSKQPDARYTASMQDPPRGGYYPAATGTPQQPRQYQFSASNPWQREEREKEQARRREAARQWRDQQIAELSALPHRTPQQEEQLRALQLERDFQKRAEEAANQQDDDDESNDADNESAQRVQGLLRMAQNQARTNPPTQQSTLSRVNAGSQSMRGNVPPQTQSTTAPMHTVSSQPTAQDSENLYTTQTEDADLIVQPQPQPQHAQNLSIPSQGPISPTYGSPLSQYPSGQKPVQPSLTQANDERERQRRIEDIKRKQAEFEENQRKRDEDIKQQQMQQQHMQQQLYQQQQQQQQQQQHQHQHQHFRNQQQNLHPSMLRLDNLVINGPSVPTNSQNDNNEAPPPPERGSSYAIMSQQSALRANNANVSNMYSLGPQQSSTIKRVSFHDPNANTEPMQRNVPSGNSNVPSSMTMDTIREDPNNFINDAETLLASPKTPEGPAGTITGATPGVIGAQEVYKDPRQKRLAEKQKQQQNSQLGAVPEKLSFKEKMKMFAMETGEDGTPRDKVKISRAQREIDNIGNPLSPNNNNNNNNNNRS